MADFAVKCWEGEHSSHVVLMVICIFVYVVGIPVAFIAWLWRHRHLIQTEAANTKAGQDFRNTYAQLFASYDTRHFYFEGVEMMKKMILAGGLVLVSPGSSVQTLVGILVAFAFFATVLQLKPYEDATDNKLRAFATAQIILTLQAGLVIQTDVNGEYEEVTMRRLLCCHRCVRLWADRARPHQHAIVRPTLIFACRRTLDRGRKPTHVPSLGQPLPLSKSARSLRAVARLCSLAGIRLEAGACWLFCAVHI